MAGQTVAHSARTSHRGSRRRASSRSRRSPYSLPYRRRGALRVGRGERADNVLVRIHTDAGLVGHAEAQPRPYTYGETQASIVAAVRGWFAPRLLGMRPGAIERGARARARASRATTAPAARSTSRCGTCSAGSRGCRARRCSAGTPTAWRSRTWLSFDTPEAMADDAADDPRRARRADVQGEGRPRPELDIAAVAAIRDALPDAVLYVDANRGWTREQAMDAGRRADRARRRGDRGADRDRGPPRADAARRALGRPARRRRELPVAHRRAPRDRRGCGRPGQRQGRAHGVLGVPRRPRAVPGGADAGRRRQPVRGCARRARLDRASARRSPTPRRGRSRRRTSSTSGTTCSPSCRGSLDGHVAVPPAPGLGYVIDEDALAAARTEG